MPLKELIKAIAMELVDHPDQVVVTEIASEHNSLIELRVAKEDVGQGHRQGGADRPVDAHDPRRRLDEARQARASRHRRLSAAPSRDADDALGAARGGRATARRARASSASSSSTRRATCSSEQDEVLVRLPDGEEHEVSVERARRADDAILMKLYSVDDRDRADELRGALVCVRRRDFPPPEDGEFYAVDIVGAEARLGGERLGEVVEIVTYPTLEALARARRRRAGRLGDPAHRRVRRQRRHRARIVES